MLTVQQTIGIKDGEGGPVMLVETKSPVEFSDEDVDSVLVSALETTFGGFFNA